MMTSSTVLNVIISALLPLVYFGAEGCTLQLATAVVEFLCDDSSTMLNVLMAATLALVYLGAGG